MDSSRSFRLALSRSAGASLVLAALLGASVAHAQSAGDRENARTMMDQADKEFASKNYAKALELYRGADDVMHVPTTGIEVAKAQEAMGQLIEARDTLLAVMRSPKTRGESGAFTAARASAESKAAAIGARIPSLQIKVTGPGGADAGDASVEVDGTAVPAAMRSIPRKVNPGKHVVKASKSGLGEATKDVEVKEAQTLDVALELKAGAAAPAGPAAPAASGAPAAPSGEPAAAPGGSTPTPDAPAPSGGLSPLVFVGFGLGVVGIGVGAVTGIMSLGKASDAKSQCVDTACAPAAQADIDSSITLANVSNIGFAAGGVGVVIGVIGLLTSSKSTPPPAAASASSQRPTVEPWIGLTSLGARGKF